MASTLNLLSTVQWTLPHLRYQPLQIGGQEPALTNANLILQTVCGPPFKWPWNRSSASFTCSPPTQDYTVNLNNFGFLESASVLDPTTFKPKELTIQTMLELDAQAERPAYISHLSDDGTVNMTFRLAPSPDIAYPINLTFQKKPGQMTSLGSLWTPIPDEMGYVINAGFLALSMLVTNDERFQIFNQRFMAHLLGRQGGLSETERNLFIGNWLMVTSMLQGSQLGTQQRFAARQA